MNLDKNKVKVLIRNFLHHLLIKLLESKSLFGNKIVYVFLLVLVSCYSSHNFKVDKIFQ